MNKFIIFTTLLLTGFLTAQIKENRDVADFSKLKASSSVQVFYTISNTKSVQVETDDAEKAKDFEPNIILISEEINSDDLVSVLEKITPGGVLIYPENKVILIEKAENYFRKLPFSPTEISKSDDNFILHTDMGNIPLISKEEDLLKNINGIQLLCQQFGVMEEDFYEPMMTFE